MIVTYSDKAKLKYDQKYFPTARLLVKTVTKVCCLWHFSEETMVFCLFHCFLKGQGDTLWSTTELSLCPVTTLITLYVKWLLVTATSSLNNCNCFFSLYTVNETSIHGCYWKLNEQLLLKIKQIPLNGSFLVIKLFCQANKK